MRATARRSAGPGLRLVTGRGVAAHDRLTGDGALGSYRVRRRLDLRRQGLRSGEAEDEVDAVCLAPIPSPQAEHSGCRPGTGCGSSASGCACGGQDGAGLGHRQQHHAAVRQPTAVEIGYDLAPPNGWRRERRDRIVGDGGRGRCANAWSRHPNIRSIRGLSHARQPLVHRWMNKTG